MMMSKTSLPHESLHLPRKQKIYALTVKATIKGHVDHDQIH